MNVDFPSSNFAGIDWNRMVLVKKADIAGYPVDGAEKYANLVYIVGADAQVGASAGILRANTSGLASSLIAKSSAGTALSIFGLSTLASVQFIHVFDSAVVPSNGAIPTLIFRVTSNSNFNFPIADTGIPFTNGIVVCNSTTDATLTLGAANCSFVVTYK